jgi:uncharacterized protein YoaH (UPF0181 family)
MSELERAEEKLVTCLNIEHLDTIADYLRIKQKLDDSIRNQTGSEVLAAISAHLTALANEKDAFSNQITTTLEELLFNLNSSQKFLLAFWLSEQARSFNSESMSASEAIVQLANSIQEIHSSESQLVSSVELSNMNDLTYSDAKFILLTLTDTISRRAQTTDDSSKSQLLKKIADDLRKTAAELPISEHDE